MALQLVCGGSGTGKSEYIYGDIIDKAIKNPGYNYIVVVPEQYTMATQKKLVNMHPNKGILNIDVVSFDRLAYKVFEEIGGENRPVLDDTGKNLIVRRVLENKKNELRFFGNTINKTGFVSEMKSVVSELLQYDIDDGRLTQLQTEIE
ncbi:MAG: helicase-exonuclease AddAB subunit AddB, partial [Lachnospira sp.]|nr:helicase-exonuclease AddAB subunit AddB [Lachnospira sp.]